jgi:hypothetical protein
MARFIYPKITQGGTDMTEEDLTSEINGERTVFTVANPYEGGTLRLYWNYTGTGKDKLGGKPLTKPPVQHLLQPLPLTRVIS